MHGTWSSLQHLFAENREYSCADCNAQMLNCNARLRWNANDWKNRRNGIWFLKELRLIHRLINQSNLLRNCALAENAQCLRTQTFRLIGAFYLHTSTSHWRCICEHWNPLGMHMLRIKLLFNVCVSHSHLRPLWLRAQKKRSQITN